MRRFTPSGFRQHPCRIEAVLRLRRFAHALIALSVMGGCATGADTTAMCQQSDRWNSASTQISLALDEIETLEAGRLREVFDQILQTLILLNQAAPREIRPDIELLLNTYGALSDALEQIDWQGNLADKDSAVTSAGVRLSSESNQQAQANLADYFGDNCSTTIDNAVNKFPSVGTTLPDPIIQEENVEPPTAGGDNESSVIRAFGYVVVERFGVAITDEQAVCVGEKLLKNNTADPILVDQTYWVLLQNIFDECQIKVDVAKELEKD